MLLNKSLLVFYLQYTVDYIVVFILLESTNWINVKEMYTVEVMHCDF